MTQRQGHSRFVRKIVATGTLSPLPVASSSRKKAYGRAGSTAFRGGRSRRTGDALTPSSRVDGQELAPVVGLGVWKAVPERLFTTGAVLEAAFREDGHPEARDRLDAARDDFAFQSVERLDASACQRRERDSFGDLDDAWAREGAEAVEAEAAERRVCARVRTALAAR